MSGVARLTQPCHTLPCKRDAMDHSMDAALKLCISGFRERSSAYLMAPALAGG